MAPADTYLPVGFEGWPTVPDPMRVFVISKSIHFKHSEAYLVQMPTALCAACPVSLALYRLLFVVT
jgi:hypothetical protein